MTDPRCVIDHRNQPADGWTVCRPCLDRLDDNLARIAEVVRIASAWLVTTRTSTAGTTTRPVPGSRPPLDLDTLDAAMATDVLPLLESWERLTREFYGLAPYGPASAARNRGLRPERLGAGMTTAPATVKGSTGFLRSQLARIAETPDYPIDDLARETRELRLRLDHLDPEYDRPDGIRVPCTAAHPEHDGRECGHRLIVNMRQAAEDITCRRCGTTTTGGRIILAALGDPNVTVWACSEDITAAIGVLPGTLRQWVNRGYVARNGNRYDVGAAWRRQQAS